MKVEIEAGVITEIRDGLQLILTNAESILRKEWSYYADRVINQVKRIDKLLPQVEYEGGINE